MDIWKEIFCWGGSIVLTTLFALGVLAEMTKGDRKDSAMLREDERRRHWEEAQRQEAENDW